MEKGKEKTSPTYIWLPWTFLSSMLPFLLLFVLAIFPDLRRYDVFSPDIYSGLPFTPWQRVDGLTSTMCVSTTVIFWGPGLACGVRNVSFSVGLRRITSRLFIIVGMGFLFFIIPMLSTILALAIDGGFLPSGGWRVYEGNHGPWRHVYHLRRLLYLTLWLPFPATGFALFSFLIKPGKASLITTLTSAGSFFFLIWTFYWLID